MTKIQLYRLVLYVLLCGCFAKASSQSHRLVINCTELTNSFLQKELQLKTVFTTKLQCKTYIEQLPILLQSKGYLAASVDSLKQDSSSSTILLFLGEKYTWRTLQIDDKDKDLLAQLGLQKEAFTAKAINQQKIILLQEKLLDYYENNATLSNIILVKG